MNREDSNRLTALWSVVLTIIVFNLFSPKAIREGLWDYTETLFGIAMIVFIAYIPYSIIRSKIRDKRWREEQERIEKWQKRYRKEEDEE